ncbi:unnamed protein product [Schistosoma mattheei]|uniref:Uncharacterized protein n=1 Tax=Schistosoma mattheei TaxID=31246 RepID=A0A3P8G6D7_9TREM|nr:unnamed protein product [Schistosoma mattheei]
MITSVIVGHIADSFSLQAGFKFTSQVSLLFSKDGSGQDTTTVIVPIVGSAVTVY